MTFATRPHRRLNPLTGEWVLVSPHRLQRPWQGRVEQAVAPSRIDYDPTCYLCPGNLRANGERNPVYTEPFVFTNDYAALLPDGESLSTAEANGLFTASTERGICRVVCFSPRHDVTLARMSSLEIRRVIDTWVAECQNLLAHPWIRSIQIFENKGAINGCSNPHPHGQIWATESIPNEVAREDTHLREWFARHGRTLLEDVGREEVARGERVVARVGEWVAIVPYWAKWPFETLVFPLTASARLEDLDAGSRDEFAEVLRVLTIRYDNLFQTSFPYTFGVHQAPVGRGGGEGGVGHWHLHAHFYPPLLRSATVQKFMVGFELLAMAQRDLTPEAAAGRLRELDDVHYLDSVQRDSPP